jgi:4-diphosphocytidyl-2-C-methyl-D-erythritol kinase
LNKLNLKAPAKLNLHLQVLRKRQDGFHDISSSFVFINLSDELELRILEDEIVLIEENPIKDNLVLRAALLLKETYKINKGAEIKLLKKIPDQAGLGGGSSDAASTLVGLNKLWELNISKKELLKIGLEIGSDVPFFINGRASWVEGRGEIFSTVKFKESWFILFFPKTKISTELAFNNLKNYKEKLITKEEFESGVAINSFTKWATSAYHEIDELFKKLSVFGSPSLTGTGSTIFLPCDTEEQAKDILLEFSEGFLVKSLHDSPLLQILE